MANYIKCLDYTGHSNGSVIIHLIRHICENGGGLTYFNEHSFGFNCYEPVWVYFLDFDTPEHQQGAKKQIEESGFIPLMDENFDPYEILMSQPITKKHLKEIKADIRYYEGLRKIERDYCEAKNKLMRKRLGKKTK